ATARGNRATAGGGVVGTPGRSGAGTATRRPRPAPGGLLCDGGVLRARRRDARRQPQPLRGDGGDGGLVRGAAGWKGADVAALARGRRARAAGAVGRTGAGGAVRGDELAGARLSDAAPGRTGG